MKCEKCGEKFGGWSNQSSGNFSCFCNRKIKAKERLLRDREITDCGCWLFTGPKIYSGYGDMKLMFRGKFVRPIHRISYLIFVGEIPEGMEIDHICRNRACYNPEHLRSVTHSHNCKLKPKKTHCPKGHDYSITGFTFPSEPNKIRCKICCSGYYKKKINHTASSNLQ